MAGEMLARAHANPTLHPAGPRPVETGGVRLSAPRTALVGIGGYGRVHLRHLVDFQRRGELVLVAAVVFPPEPDTAERQVVPSAARTSSCPCGSDTPGSEKPVVFWFSA